MKIAHWCSTIEGISGLTVRVREMVEIEKEFGHDSRILSTSHEDGNTEGRYRFEPWKWAIDEADVNIVDSHVPQIFDKLRNRVFITHGAPYHCVAQEVYNKRHSFMTSIMMIQQCELVITWNPHHEVIWKEFGGNIHTVIGGVDLKKWVPEGSKIQYVSKPTALIMDTPRDNKLPTQTLFAVMKAHRNIPGLRLDWIAIPKDAYPFWSSVVKAIGVDVITHMVPALVINPADFYRGASMLIHPVQGGAIGGLGMEALACGCPVVIFKGEDEKVATAKCAEYDPEDMARCIEQIWKMYQQDPVKVREEARDIAVKYYDLRRSVSEMMALYEELV